LRQLLRQTAAERNGAIDLLRALSILYIVGFWHLLGYAPSVSGYKNALTHRLTVVVLGGMGSFAGAMLGGVIVGVTESLGGLLLGEALGQIGISVIFIAILLFRPTGLFGARV